MTMEGTGPFKCPRCGETTWGAQDYCTECGIYLYNVCPKCGAEWRYMFEHTFCPNCGTKVELAAKKAAPRK